VEVESIVAGEEAHRVLAPIQTKNIRHSYAQIPARFGVINHGSEDPRWWGTTNQRKEPAMTQICMAFGH
jgi:hypothetical protein